MEENDIFEIKSIAHMETSTYDDGKEGIRIFHLDASGLLNIIQTCARTSAAQVPKPNEDPTDIGMLANADIVMLRDGRLGISFKTMAFKPDFNPFGKLAEALIDAEEFFCDVFIVPLIDTTNEGSDKSDEDDLDWLNMEI